MSAPAVVAITSAIIASNAANTAANAARIAAQNNAPPPPLWLQYGIEVMALATLVLAVIVFIMIVKDFFGEW